MWYQKCDLTVDASTGCVYSSAARVADVVLPLTNFPFQDFSDPPLRSERGCQIMAAKKPAKKVAAKKAPAKKKAAAKKPAKKAAKKK